MAQWEDILVKGIILKGLDNTIVLSLHDWKVLLCLNYETDEETELLWGADDPERLPMKLSKSEAAEFGRNLHDHLLQLLGEEIIGKVVTTGEFQDKEQVWHTHVLTTKKGWIECYFRHVGFLGERAKIVQDVIALAERGPMTIDLAHSEKLTHEPVQISRLPKPEEIPKLLKRVEPNITDEKALELAVPDPMLFMQHEGLEC